MAVTGKDDILSVADAGIDDVTGLLRRYGLTLVVQGDAEPITASYWGDPEAGVAGKTIYVRADTPLHSLLHESCHIICMTGARRAVLVRDAGGNHLEESAVCYLQVVLSDVLSACGKDRIMMDMDAWGYSFRLGSTAGWFYQDADDAEKFLITHGLLTDEGIPTYNLRD